MTGTSPVALGALKEIRVAVPNPPISENTRHRIVEEAIRLMGERGLRGVSLRTINAAAECQNVSAIHYHFGGRQGLITAAIHHVLGPTTRRRERLFQRIRGRVQQGETFTLRDVLEALCLPFLTLMLDPAHGPAACRFMARATFEADENIQAVMNEIMAPQIAEGARMLHELLPDLPLPVLIFRVMMVPVNVVYGTADVHVLYNSPMGNVAPEPPVEIFQRFFEYIEGAMTAPWSNADAHLADRIADAMLEEEANPQESL